MDRPFFGRTGWLENKLCGAGEHPLPTASPSKWHPENAFTVPQCLLDYLHQKGGSLPQSFGVFLLLQALTEELADVWCSGSGSLPCTKPPSDPRVVRRRLQATLLDYLLWWHYKATADDAPSDGFSDFSKSEGDVTLSEDDWKTKEKQMLRPSTAASSATTLDEPPTLTWYVPKYTLVTLKGKETMERHPNITSRSVTLIGRLQELSHIHTQHPSCSSEHAALQIGFCRVGWAGASHVSFGPETEDEEGGRGEEVLIDKGEWFGRMQAIVAAAESTSRVKNEAEPKPSLDALCASCKAHSCDADVRQSWDRCIAAAYDRLLSVALEKGGGSVESAFSVELQLVDLQSTNGTFIAVEDDEEGKAEGWRLEPFKPVVLMEGDTFFLGASTRRYLVMRL